MMPRIKDPPEENSLLGRWARWTAAPYCEFKDDRARLLALVARDVRKVAIVIVLAITGEAVPWHGWAALFLGLVRRVAQCCWPVDPAQPCRQYSGAPSLRGGDSPGFPLEDARAYFGYS